MITELEIGPVRTLAQWLQGDTDRAGASVDHVGVRTEGDHLFRAQLRYLQRAAPDDALAAVWAFIASLSDFQ